jgi:hypothetical protein
MASPQPGDMPFRHEFYCVLTELITFGNQSVADAPLWVTDEANGELDQSK